VLGVELSSCLGSPTGIYTALKSVSTKLTKRGIKIQLSSPAVFVGRCLEPTDQTGSRHVVKSVRVKLLEGLRKVWHKIRPAQYVELPSKVERLPSTALTNVLSEELKREDQKCTRHLQIEPALSVEEYIKAIQMQLSTVGRSVEEVFIIGKSEKRKEKTYNLAVEGTQTYLVNGGVVVHNCDLISMAFVSMEAVYPTAEAAEYEPFEQVSGKYWGKWDGDKDDSGSSVIF
jgi:hypothetical protein